VGSGDLTRRRPATLRRYEDWAGRMGSTTYMVPPLAVLLGWIFLGEVPPLLALPGDILCLAGVVLARSRIGRRRADPTPAAVGAAGG
jgi:hypothetical protein